jgi:hypothetical protein
MSACEAAGAPSFELFGAFFPAWMFCALAGVLTAVLGRAIFVTTNLSTVLPLQLALCTALGVIGGLLVWWLLV